MSVETVVTSHRRDVIIQLIIDQRSDMNNPMCHHFHMWSPVCVCLMESPTEMCHVTPDHVTMWAKECGFCS